MQVRRSGRQSSGTAVLDRDDDNVGFVASAARIRGGAKIKRAIKYESWQDELWGFYDSCGEFRYSVDWTGQAGGRAELEVVKQEPGKDPVKVTSGLPVEYLDELLDSCGGPAQFIQGVMVHLVCPGESWVVGQDIVDDTTGQVVSYRWQILDASEFDTTGGITKVPNPDTGEKEQLGDSALLIRIWQAHPRKKNLANSPARAVLGVLREIENIGKHIGATVDSRLAGNGVLLLPKEVTLTAASGETVDAQTNRDEFMAKLTEAMITPIGDRDSAEAVVPIILRMAGEFIDKVKHLTFGTTFDAMAQTLRDNAIRRLALGLDLPPEQLLGLGGTNHWSAWQIEEAGVKVVIEPKLQLICDALTTQWLVPMLEAANVLDADLYRVRYKVDKLILRPNRSEDAFKAYDRGEIGGRALRDATGFNDGDLPSDQELQRMLMIELIRLGKVDLQGKSLARPDISPGEEIPGITPPPGETKPPQSLPPAPSQRPADPTPKSSAAETATALLAAAEALVLRALERAGNKRRGRGDRNNPTLASVPDHKTHMHLSVSPEEVERLLENAWSLAASTAELHGVDPVMFQGALHGFTKALLIAGVPYDVKRRPTLATTLAAAVAA